jgi:hypothetical protein
MDEMGHTDPGLALRVYAQAMRRGEDETSALRALVEGGVMANSGQREETRSLHTRSGWPLDVKNSAICRVFSQYPRQESNLDPPLRRPTPLRTDRLDL